MINEDKYLLDPKEFQEGGDYLPEKYLSHNFYQTLIITGTQYVVRTIKRYSEKQKRKNILRCRRIITLNRIHEIILLRHTIYHSGLKV